MWMMMIIIIITITTTTTTTTWYLQNNNSNNKDDDDDDDDDDDTGTKCPEDPNNHSGLQCNGEDIQHLDSATTNTGQRATITALLMENERNITPALTAT